MKLGKQKFTHDDRDLKLSDYLTDAAPKPPSGDFGHFGLVSSWGMLGNDTAGDCVWAGAGHETMMLGAEGGHHPAFTTESILSDYSAVTGYVPGDESTDEGTEVRTAMAYRAKTGITDAKGEHHRIGAYVQIKPGDVDELYQAVYLFGCVGIGIEFPESAMSEFNEGKEWSVTSSPIEGGHYIPVVGRQDSHPICVTWGKTQPMTEGFYEKYTDEAWCFLSAADLKAGKTPEGFDKEQLLADLHDLYS